jgi:hypothetical protein
VRREAHAPRAAASGGRGRLARAVRGAALAMLAGLPGPPRAEAQWARETDLPASPVYSLAQRGDTILAGVDDAVYVSVDGGGSWVRSADVGTPPSSVDAVWIERGRLWAGTYGQGAWTSGDLGASWQDASAGLAGGFFNSHLYVVDFESRGDSLYAGTAGAGTFVKHLGTLAPWSVFGPSLVSTSSGSVTDLARAGQRLMVAAEANGGVHLNDRDDPEWTRVPLVPEPGGSGLQASSFLWTGADWLAATQLGVFRSPTGTGGWQLASPWPGAKLETRLAGPACDGCPSTRVFLAANSLSDVEFLFSVDGGASWTAFEALPTYVFDLLLRDDVLYVARLDGLWRRTIATLGTPGREPAPGVGLALAGANPVRGATSLRISLPSAGPVRLTVTDVAGRSVGLLADGDFPAGDHALAWDARGLAPGVHFLSLETRFGSRVVRAVLLR